MPTKLYENLTKAPEPGRPLIFAFHGTGGDERQLFQLAGQLAPGVGVVSPRGDVLEGGAARFFKRMAEGVYDMEDLSRATAKMADFISAHRALYPDCPAYGFGYSNGANILAAVFLEQPDLFDRVGLLHPLVTWEMPQDLDLSGRKVVLTAGRNDPITPWPKSARLIEDLQRAGADIETDVHDGGHELRDSELAALVRGFAD
ncbi:alpha/beta hydrolase [Roseibium alexandrii]|uniref:Putative esterase n=1 Tax=Roseibium alexandrii (strain DSM 17067 / NCIMB 14079 / DFL-11) TaxID=244592 RepID=A0A5E8H5P9_ROSAD|nr:alpha/beta hydrolase [Roseibium alexandrii]EEE47314.1 putative esterase [Roseibium alexandrii DFL-11]